MSKYEFRPTRPHPAWIETPQEQWESWTWQLQNRITKLDDFKRISQVDSQFQVDLEDIARTQTDFDFAITPYYFSLIEMANSNCPIRKQAIPSSLENKKLDFELIDFPKEESMMPVPGLTHRYPDRAMLYTTHHCAVYCRFCTRKRKVSDASTALRSQQISQAVDYIRSTKQIREVILSGGDIFSLSNDALGELLDKVRSIEHVEIIRLGTRNLVTLPFRVTDQLVSIVKQFHPIYVHTHFNHPVECSLEAQQACLKLRRAGIQVNNHTVMLKGINDKVETLRELNQRLLLMGVQPYYIYHCDLTYGTSHFRTKISDDLGILRSLREKFDWSKDSSLPHYMVDTPGGGKIELF